MSLMLGHRINQGVNIDGIILLKVLCIDPEKQEALIEVKTRDLDLTSKTPSITEHKEEARLRIQEKIKLSSDISVTFFMNPVEDWMHPEFLYDAKPHNIIARVDFLQEKESWRPAFESEGLERRLFESNPSETWTMTDTNGRKYGFAAAAYPALGIELTYLLVQEGERWSIITRMSQRKFYLGQPFDNDTGEREIQNKLIDLISLSSYSEDLKKFASLPAKSGEWRFNSKTINNFVKKVNMGDRLKYADLPVYVCGCDVRGQICGPNGAYSRGRGPGYRR